MKNNKIAIYISTAISVVGVFAAYGFNNPQTEFVSNLFLGLFGSAIVSFAISIINYFTEKERAYYDFWVAGRRIIDRLSKYPCKGTLDEKVLALIRMNEIDYAYLDDAYSRFDFIFNKKKKIALFETIYRPAMEIRTEIQRRANHADQYRRGKEPEPIMKIHIEKFEKVFLIKTENPMSNDIEQQGLETIAQIKPVWDMEQGYLSAYGKAVLSNEKYKEQTYAN